MDNTGIEWTNATWNPWHGCAKVSAGCKNCYMFREKKRYGQDPAVVIRSKTKFEDPLKWVSRGKAPKYCFTCSWSDFFIEQADLWRAEAWEIIRDTPEITYQILTKRPERISAGLPDDWGNGYPNAWLGVSCENQAAADERIPQLLQAPAAARFISAEPLLGPIDITRWTRVAWQCSGCREYFAGPYQRICPSCSKDSYWTGTQEGALGSHHHFPDGATVRRVGKKAAGATLDGREWREFPA